jgi:hypothetical protein
VHLLVLVFSVRSKVKVYVMTNCVEHKEVGVFVVANKNIPLSAQLVTALAETVVSQFKHGISRSNLLDFSSRGEDTLIGMTTDVSKCRLTQISHSRCR